MLLPLFQNIKGSYLPISYGINFIIILISDEWKNFLARIGRDENTHESELSDSPNDILELRFWASYRGQTLARTGNVLFVFYFSVLLVSS